MAVQDDFQQRSDLFMAWLREQHAVSISSKIALVDHRTCGRGRAVVATANIENNEMLFQIPQHLVMDARTSDLRKHIKDELRSLEPWQQMVLIMIYESGKGEGSRWYPYFQVLPERADDILMNWSDEELRELQGSAVLGRVGKHDVDAQFEKAILPILAKNHDLFGAFAEDFKGPHASKFSLELCHRLSGIMMAYAFDVEDDFWVESENGDIADAFEEDEDEDFVKGMIPLADMLNASGAKNNANISYGERELQMAANRSIRAGEEIYNTYGSLPRADLLRRYGYINDDYMPYDVVEVRTSRIIDIVGWKLHFSEKERKSRTQGDYFGVKGKIELLLQGSLAAQTGFDGEIFEDAYDIANTSASSGHFPLPLVYTIWLLVAHEAEAKVLKASPSAEPRFNIKVAWVLQKLLTDREKEYATSIEEDEGIMQQPALSTRRRMAVEVRLGEKMILREGQEYLDRIEQKLPAGFGAWDANFPATTYILGEDLLVDDVLERELNSKRRKVG